MDLHNVFTYWYTACDPSVCKPLVYMTSILFMTASLRALGGAANSIRCDVEYCMRPALISFPLTGRRLSHPYTSLPDWIIPDLIIYVAVQNATRHAARASVGQPLVFFFWRRRRPVLRRREWNARVVRLLRYLGAPWKLNRNGESVRIRCGQRSSFQRRPWNDGDGCGWSRRRRPSPCRR